MGDPESAIEKSKSNDKNNEKLNLMVPSNLDPFSLRLFLRQRLKKMPAQVQKRITVLKNLQVDFNKIRVDYFSKMYELERKFHEIFKTFYQTRAKIISGELDPPEQKPKWKIEDHNADMLEKYDFITSLMDIQNLPDNVKGIPDFWVSIFRSYDILSQIVYEDDVPALRALRDIQIQYDEQISFTLEFYFDANPYFSNEVLTKKYFIKNAINEDNPFVFEGLEVYKSEGCAIDWKEGMNLNVRTIRKRERHKETGAMRFVIKQIPRKSFFKFFNPPNVELHIYQPIDANIHEELRIDFGIGHFLREQIIPKAILYYSGELNDDDDDDDENDDQHDDGDESTESDEECGGDGQSDIFYIKYN